MLANVTIVDCIEEPTAAKHCGQYGFRCVEFTTFEICNEPDLDGNVEPDEVHHCPSETICDEDNPSYCSPELENYHRNETCNSKAHRSLNIHQLVQNRGKLDINNGIDNDSNEPDPTTTVPTLEDDPWNNCEDEKYTEAPAFQCESNGFFTG